MEWSLQGKILAPQETQEEALARFQDIDLDIQKVQKNISIPLYDFSTEKAFVIESDEALWPWQGAALWEYVLEGGIKCPVIQVRKGWKGKKEKEALEHELVHGARVSFQEPLFEEILAYQTSSSAFKRFLGPLFLFPWEAAVFAGLSCGAPLFSLFFGSLKASLCLAAFAVLLFFRLLILHLLFAKCRKKLRKAGVRTEKCLAVMVRLSDWEMIKTALRSPEKTASYFLEESQRQLRIEILWKAYFQTACDF